jgi:hypothetical protein
MSCGLVFMTIRLHLGRGKQGRPPLPARFVDDCLVGRFIFSGDHSPSGIRLSGNGIFGKSLFLLPIGASVELRISGVIWISEKNAKIGY